MSEFKVYLVTVSGKDLKVHARSEHGAVANAVRLWASVACRPTTDAVVQSVAEAVR